MTATLGKRQQAKEFLRQIAIKLCGGLLQAGSKLSSDIDRPRG